MAELPAHPVFWSDFFADTEHMSEAGAKAYLFIIGHSWIRGGKIKNDDRLIARLTRLSFRRWMAVRDEVMEMLETDEDGFVFQRRVKKDYVNVQRRANVNRKNGAKGGRAKASKKSNENNDRTKANATNSPERNESESLASKTITKDSESDTTVRESISNSSTDPNHCSADAHAPPERGEAKARRKYDFDEWWSCWSLPGTKRSRVKAERKYRALIAAGTSDHETLCIGVKRYMTWCAQRGDPPSKIKHPTTWLEAGAWDDELVIENQHGTIGNGQPQRSSGHRRDDRPTTLEAAQRVLDRMEGRGHEDDQPSMAGHAENGRAGPGEGGNLRVVGGASAEPPTLEGVYSRRDGKFA